MLGYMLCSESIMGGDTRLASLLPTAGKAIMLLGREADQPPAWTYWCLEALVSAETLPAVPCWVAAHWWHINQWSGAILL